MVACILGAISESTYATFVDVTRSLIKVKPYLVKKPGQELNPANIKVENNGAVGYVGSSLTVHNPLFFVHRL